MKYLKTDFNKELSKLSPAAFKKFYLKHGELYGGTWEAAYKAIGGKVEKPEK